MHLLEEVFDKFFKISVWDAVEVSLQSFEQHRSCEFKLVAPGRVESQEAKEVHKVAQMEEVLSCSLRESLAFQVGLAKRI